MEPEWEEIGDPSRVDSLQPNHSLLWRSIEKKVLPLCIENNIAVITYSSLCQGILTGRFKKPSDAPEDSRKSNRRFKEDCFPAVQSILEILKEVAAKYDKSMAQTAIRWLLDQEGITCAIVGASRPEQVDENLGAMDWKLEKEDWDRLADATWALSEPLKPHDSIWNWHPRAK